jgi:succinoglycan biosynthesis transport protein ExoP
VERDAKSQRDLLESYLAKYREATARDSIGAAAPDARIISTATISNTPSWPKKVPTILVASLAMLVLSSAFVLTGELLRAMPQEQVILERGVPSLRTASPRRAQSPTGADLIATAEAMGSRRTETASDRVEELARGLSQAGEGGRRVTVVSAVPDVHTTPTAIALARRLAEEKRVVLVELAGGESNLSAIADASAPGLTQLVAGYASFGEIITRDRSSRVHLVLAGAPVLDSEPILASARLTIAIEALARSYDHVVLDAGAAGETALDRLATLAPRAVLLPAQDAAKTALARERLLSAGFATVELLAGTPSQTTRAA